MLSVMAGLSNCAFGAIVLCLWHGYRRIATQGSLLMVCVDTSVLVALLVNEPKSAAVARWYAACDEELTSAVWCVTEFARALGIKQRTAQISAAQGATAWQAFERLCAGDLQPLPLEPATFHRAAVPTLDATTGLRAGDALHLAAALQAKAKRVAPLDDVLSRNAKQMKIAALAF